MAKVIGHIYPGEAYIYYMPLEGHIDEKQWYVNTTNVTLPVYDDFWNQDGSMYNYSIQFHNGSLFPKNGFVEYLIGVELPQACSASYTNSEGTFKVATLRRQEEIFNSSGSEIGNLPKDTKVAFKNGTCGETKRHLLYIDYYQRPTDSWYVKANCFVDTGAVSYGCANNWSIVHSYNK